MFKKFKDAWRRQRLEIYVVIPFVEVKTRILTRPIERRYFEVCRLYIKVWKWHVEFDWYMKEVL